MQSTGSGSYVGTNTPTPCFSSSSTSTPSLFRRKDRGREIDTFWRRFTPCSSSRPPSRLSRSWPWFGDLFKAITESREGVTWSMDTLLPVCMYVVVRARVLQLGAELAMLQELMEDFLFQVISRVYQSKIVS